MEERKLSKGVIWLIIVLGLIILGLVGYIVYDKVIVKKNNDENGNLTNGEKISMTEIFFNGIAIVYNGEVFANCDYSSGLLSINVVYQDDTLSSTLTDTRLQKYKKYSFDSIEYYNGNDETNQFNGLKLNDSDVKRVYVYDEGQTITEKASLLLMHNDGTLSVISMYSLINGRTEVTKIEGLKDVTAIVTEQVGGIGGGNETFAVKKDGKKEALKQYMPTDYKNY